MAETVNQSNEGTVARVSVLEERVMSIRTLMDERDHRYLDRFMAMDEKTSLALTSSEKAVAKAESATEKRFDSVNEFRETLKDQASTLISRVEADTRFNSYDDKLDDVKKEIAGLRESRSEIGGKSVKHLEDRSLTQWLVGLAVLIGGIILGHFWK